MAYSTARETWELNVKVSVLPFSPRKRNTIYCVKLWRIKTSSGVVRGLPIKGGDDSALHLLTTPSRNCHEAALVDGALMDVVLAGSPTRLYIC